MKPRVAMLHCSSARRVWPPGLRCDLHSMGPRYSRSGHTQPSGSCEAGRHQSPAEQPFGAARDRDRSSLVGPPNVPHQAVQTHANWTTGNRWKHIHLPSRTGPAPRRCPNASKYSCLPPEIHFRVTVDSYVAIKRDKSLYAMAQDRHGPRFATQTASSHGVVGPGANSLQRLCQIFFFPSLDPPKIGTTGVSSAPRAAAMTSRSTPGQQVQPLAGRSGRADQRRGFSFRLQS